MHSGVGDKTEFLIYFTTAALPWADQVDFFKKK